MYNYRDDDYTVCPMAYTCCCPLFRQPNGVPTPPHFPGTPGHMPPPPPGGGFGMPGHMPPPPPGGGPGIHEPQGHTFGPPGPPPSQIPAKTAKKGALGAPTPKFVEPGAIRPCLYQYVYIWLENGRSFWAWLVFVGNRSAAGWRWNGRRWVYFGIDLDDIEEFICY